MATEERNFRSYYYEKVGFRGVEEKKSLAIILSEKPVSKVKLKQFVLRFPVPGTFRNQLWKLLLDVVPLYRDNVEFVLDQQKQQYEDIVHVLQVTQLVTSDTTKHTMFLIMWLLEKGRIKFELSEQLEESTNKHLLSVSKALIEMFDTNVEMYFVAKGFFKHIEKYHEHIPKYTEALFKLCQKEDEELCSHLRRTGIMQSLPIDIWICSLFSGIFPTSALERIWDKLVGGASVILIYVAASLLVYYKKILLAASSYNLLDSNLWNVSEDVADKVSTNAIDLWQKHGSFLNLTADSNQRTSRF